MCPEHNQVGTPCKSLLKNALDRVTFPYSS